MTCKDCVHCAECKFFEPYHQYIKCNHFKNKADFVEVVRCKDCIHEKLCKARLSKQGYQMYADKDLIVEDCKHFKNKADFVEVVRCRDCSHYIDGKCYVSNRSPLFKYNVNIHSRGKDDYCSYGERKEDNG